MLVKSFIRLLLKVNYLKMRLLANLELSCFIVVLLCYIDLALIVFEFLFLPILLLLFLLEFLLKNFFSSF